MTVEPSATTVVVGLIIAAVPTVIGWLVIRAVRGVDRTLDAMGRKIEQLVHQDTRTQVEFADLRARLVHIEILVLGKSVGGGRPAEKP